MNVSAISRHPRILGSLLLREIVTRFGREGIGFLWVIGEPLMFCVGVILLWSALKPEYEHGIRVAPFVMTGYMCLILVRHMIGMSIGALQANVGLLYHRDVSVLHVFLARNLMEFLGATAAFVVVYVGLLAFGQVGLPHNWLLMYCGWLLMGWVAFGVAFFLAALAMRFEVLERLTSVISYVMIPFSGAFIMVDWIPPQWREAYLLVPLPHGVEMVRGGVFGEFTHTYYHPAYAFAWGGALIFAGLVLMVDARDRIIVD